MFHAVVDLLLGVFFLDVVFGFGTNQHLICKTVDDVFSDGSTRNHATTTPRVLHGPPGKKGQRGVKGEAGIPGLKGEKGLPGVVDSQDVQNVIEEKLREANRELQTKVERLEQLVAKITTSVAGAIQLACDDDLLYNGKCYFAIIHNAADVNYEEAKSLCIAKGGSPADILNRDHEDMVVRYIRGKTTRSGTTYLFLGMSYMPSTSTLQWSSGEKVPEDTVASLKWWGGYPDARLTFVKMAIGVGSQIGIFNAFPNYDRHGVLCEM